MITSFIRPPPRLVLHDAQTTNIMSKKSNEEGAPLLGWSGSGPQLQPGAPGVTFVQMPVSGSQNNQQGIPRDEMCLDVSDCSFHFPHLSLCQRYVYRSDAGCIIDEFTTDWETYYWAPNPSISTMDLSESFERQRAAHYSFSTFI